MSTLYQVRCIGRALNLSSRVLETYPAAWEEFIAMVARVRSLTSASVVLELPDETHFNDGTIVRIMEFHNTSKV